MKNVAILLALLFAGSLATLAQQDHPVIVSRYLWTPPLRLTLTLSFLSFH
jgi:hypothetical protein